MGRADEALGRLRQQRVLRRRLLLDTLAKTKTFHTRALARGNPRMVAHYAGQIERTEQALAALDAALDDDETHP